MKTENIIKQLQTKLKLYRMGYSSDQQGILNRYLREKSSWDDHLNHSRQFILKSLENKEKGKVVVLGSGWLLDLPIHELATQFKQVVLVDIRHPAQILKKISKYSNIITQNEDITGGMIDFFYYNRKNLKQNKPLIIPENIHFSVSKDADFVISLNILCQLHIILMDYIKSLSVKTAIDFSALEKQIQHSHISMLPKGKSCLITDIEEEILNPDNELIGINPLIRVDLPEGNFSQHWQWKFDTQMTYREDAKTYFNTKAIDF